MKASLSKQRGTPDFFLLLLTFLLVGFGLVMVFSASYNKSVFEFDNAFHITKRQVMWAVLGTFGMLALMNTHYGKLKKWFVPFFIAVVVMLILVLFIGEVRNGAKSWFAIGSIGGQPSEFAKLGIILYLASLISKKGEKFRDFHKGLLPVMIIVGFVAGLIMLQPDLGTCMVFLFCALTVIVAGGANLKHLFLSCSIILFIAGMFISLRMLTADNYGYQYDRIASYIDPWSDPLNTGYQLIQSLYAFGHGGLTGAGFGRSIQKLHYLPEAHNDFIFAIIAEELGFIGTTLFLILYLLFLWRGLIIALRCPDIFGTLVGTGIVGMIAIQALINIGGVTGAIPITGVTLPFISYGGSSLLVCLLGIGILLSISRENSLAEKEKSPGSRQKLSVHGS